MDCNCAHLPEVVHVRLKVFGVGNIFNVHVPRACSLNDLHEIVAGIISRVPHVGSAEYWFEYKKVKITSDKALRQALRCGEKPELTVASGFSLVTEDNIKKGGITKNTNVWILGTFACFRA